MASAICIFASIFFILNFSSTNAVDIEDVDAKKNEIDFAPPNDVTKPEDAFLGVYSECVLYLSYTCIQRKTLHYLNRLEKQDELQIIGKYVTFVKIDPGADKNQSKADDKIDYISDELTPSTQLAKKIDERVSNFFNSHILRIRYGNNSKEDVNVGKVLDIVEGRKKSKGDSGGGEGGKKKMMMMAMMMMKMKLMMMLPAMMGMMGMMSIKGVLLGGLSLLISKILLIMKLMGGMGGGKGSGGGGGGGHGGGGGGGGGPEQGWMGGGGGGGWNQGGGQDFGHGGGGGGGGGGYNANGEWQSRSGRDVLKLPSHHHHHLDIPVISHRRKRDDGLLTPFDTTVYKLNYNQNDTGRGKNQNVDPEKRGDIKGNEARGKHKKVESMSSYMKGMKDAVDDNLWD